MPPKAARRIEEDRPFTRVSQLTPVQLCPIDELAVGRHTVFVGPTGCGKTKVALFAGCRFLSREDGQDGDCDDDDDDDILADVSVLFVCATVQTADRVFRGELPRLQPMHRDRFIVKTYHELDTAETVAEVERRNVGLVVLDDADVMRRADVDALNTILVHIAFGVPAANRPLVFILGDPLPLLPNSDETVDVLYEADTLIGVPSGELDGQRPIRDAEFGEVTEMMDSWTLSVDILRWFEASNHTWSTSTIREEKAVVYTLNKKRVEWWDQMYCYDRVPSRAQVDFIETDDALQAANDRNFGRSAAPLVADGAEREIIDIPTKRADVAIRATRWLRGDADLITQINSIYRAASRAQQRVLITTECARKFSPTLPTQMTQMGVERRSSLLEDVGSSSAENSMPAIPPLNNNSALTQENSQTMHRQGSVPSPGEPVQLERTKSYQRNQLTDEQRGAFDTVVKDGKNVVLNAVAGSGKSTTSLTIAKAWLEQYPGCGNVLFLSYNRRLRFDMEALVFRMDSDIADKIKCRTLHSYAYRNYRMVDQPRNYDSLLTDPVDHDAPPRQDADLNFGLVVLDEAQDFTDDYTNFVKKLLRDLHRKAQVIICGDPFQLLYAYSGATTALLYRPEEILVDCTKSPEFDRHKLSISFRITHEMAEFINKNLNPKNLVKHDPVFFANHCEEILDFWGDGIRANPNLPPAPGSLEYINRTTVRPWKSFYDMIRRSIAEFTVSRSVLLAGSVKEGTPASRVKNDMSDLEWTTHGGDESGEFDESERNTMVATTVNQYKGREQDLVIFMGFDEWIQRKNMQDPQAAFNKLYVACTRARKRLVIVQTDRRYYCTHENYTGIPEMAIRKMKLPVTDFLSYLRSNPHKTLSTEKMVWNVPKQTISPQNMKLPKTIRIPDGDDNNGCFGRFRRSGRHHGGQKAPDVIGTLAGVYLQLKIEGSRYRFPFGLDEIVEEEKGKPESERSEPKVLACEMIKEFVDSVHSQLSKGHQLDMLTISELALAQTVLGSGAFQHWRQIDPTVPWAICHKPIGKHDPTTALDRLLENSIKLIHVAFCCRTQQQMNAHQRMTIEEQLGVLQQLSKRKRIRFEHHVARDLSHYKYFRVVVGPGLVGFMDIVLLPSKESVTTKDEPLSLVTPEKTQKGKSGDDDFDDPTPPGETVIVEMKVTAKPADEHRLQVLLYGAMYAEECMNYRPMSTLEQSISGRHDELLHFFPKMLPHPDDKESQPSAGEKVKPSAMSTYLMYPNHGELRHVVPQVHPHDLIVRLATLKMNFKWEDHEEAMKQLSEEPTISEEAAKIYQENGFPQARAGITQSEVFGFKKAEDSQRPSGFVGADQLSIGPGPF